MQKTKDKHPAAAHARPPVPPRPRAPAPADDDDDDEESSQVALKTTATAALPSEADTTKIVSEEEALLLRVNNFLTTYRPSTAADPGLRGELISLRDQIAVARLEDVPALVQQMERIAGIAARRVESVSRARRSEVPVLRPRPPPRGGPRRPRRAHRQDHADRREGGVRIVDWRHAPVSQIYYKYEEGAEYEETLGERDVEGTVLARRTVTIQNGELLRVSSPQGVFVKSANGLAQPRHRLGRARGRPGQGRAPDRACGGVLGIDDSGLQREDRHLPEIAALLDPRQFELISKPDTGSSSSRAAPAAARPPSACTARVPRLPASTASPPTRCSSSSGAPRCAPTSARCCRRSASTACPSRRTASGRASSARSTSPGSTSRVEEDTPSVVTRLKTHRVMLRLLERSAARSRRPIRAPARLARHPRLLGRRAHRQDARARRLRGGARSRHAARSGPASVALVRRALPRGRRVRSGRSRRAQGRRRGRPRPPSRRGRSRRRRESGIRRTTAPPSTRGRRPPPPRLPAPPRRAEARQERRSRTSTSSSTRRKTSHRSTSPSCSACVAHAHRENGKTSSPAQRDARGRHRAAPPHGLRLPTGAWCSTISASRASTSSRSASPTAPRAGARARARTCSARSPTPRRPIAPRTRRPGRAPRLPEPGRGRRLPRRRPAPAVRRASPTRPSRSSRATPSRPTSTSRPSRWPRSPTSAASARTSSPSGPASRSPRCAR
jgi:hypothetical protein